MSLQVWLPLNGDLHNQGLSNITVTNNGATVDNSGKIGKCYSVGSSKRITSTIDTSKLKANSISFACWVYITSWNSSYDCIMSIADGTGWNQSRATLCRNNTASTLTWNIANNSASARVSTTTSISLNTWTHIAATYDGATLKIYLNGVLNNSAATTLSIVYAGALNIGSWTNANNYPLTGKINDVRIYDHALSPKEVEEIAKGLVLHYKLDGETQVVVPPGYQQLEYIESTGASWLNTGYTFNPETDSCKVIFKGNDTSNNGMIFASSSGKYFWLYYYSAGMNIYATNSSGTQKSITGPSRDTNQHTVIYQNKHYYFDGVDKGALADSYVQDTAESYLFSYGASGTNYPFKGRIYYVEISRNNVIQKIFIPVKQLSDNVIGVYDIIGKQFKPSMTSTAFTAGPNASITGAIYDSSGYSHNGTIVGSLTAAADSPRYDVATVFNGSSLIEADPLPTETKTISVWVNFADTSGSAYRMVLHDKGSTLAIGYYSSKIITYVSASNDGGTGSCVTANLSSNTWYHITVVKTGALTRDVYINGEKATATSNNWWGGDLVKFSIGGRHVSGAYSSYVTGKIADVRAYAAALTVDQVKELYNTSMSIDSNGNVYARELSEL